MLKKIDEREREIKDAMANEEHLKQEYGERIEGIDSDIETKEEEIEQLKNERENLAKEVKIKIAKVWNALSLPLDLFTPLGTPSTIGPSHGYAGKAGRVTLQELVNAGLVRDGQTLYFHHAQLFQDEQAQIIASSNKLKYKTDGKIYSISELAKILLIKHGI